MIDANTVFGFWPRRKVDISLERLLAMAAKHGVEQILSLSMKGVLYDDDEGNAETLRAARRHKEIIPVATIDPRKYFKKDNKVSRLRDQGFKMLRLCPDLQGWPIEYLPFYAIVEELEEVGLPLMISLPARGDATRIVRITKGSDFPVIMTNIWYGLYSEIILAARASNNIYAETHWFDSPDAYEVLVDAIGANRIVFGSMMPLYYFHASCLLLKNAGVSKKQKNLIDSGNIKRLIS